MFPIVFLALVVCNNASIASTPTSVVKETIDKVMKTLADVDESPDRKWRVIAKTINPTFDFRSLSQRSIDSSWKEASIQDKKKLIDYFSQYLEDVYRSKMKGFVPSRIDYVSEQIRKDRAIVDSFVFSGTQKYLVSYRLKHRDDGWYIYDVFIDDSSVVDNWKEVFGAILKSEGLEGLLNKLELSVDEYSETENTDFKQIVQ